MNFDFSITRLTARLAQTPDSFLQAEAPGAVAADLLAAAGGPRPDTAALAPLRQTGTAAQRNLAAVRMIACHLLHDPAFLADGTRGPVLWSFLTSPLLDSLAQLVPATEFVTDPDRREELVRQTLKFLDCLPAGETPAQAADRLTTLDSAERARVISQARKAQERARELAAELARREAEEAASKWTRE